MQRNSADFRGIARCAAVLTIAVFYEAFSTIYFLMPPLFGLCFAFAAIKKEARFMWCAIIYVFFYEADRLLMFGGAALFLYIYLRYILPLLEDLIMSRYVIMIISVLAAYVGYYLFINVIYFAFGTGAISLSWLLFYYAAIEAVVAVVILG